MSDRFFAMAKDMQFCTHPEDEVRVSSGLQVCSNCGQHRSPSDEEWKLPYLLDLVLNGTNEA